MRLHAGERVRVPPGIRGKVRRRGPGRWGPWGDGGRRGRGWRDGVRRPLAALPAILMAGALLIAGCSSPSGHPAATVPPSAAASGAGSVVGGSGALPATIAGYDAQKLTWRPCNNGFQCARLLVPFDYQRPGWQRFSLPVIRLPASDPAHRIGSLVINPGGPGGSGIQYARQARQVVSAAARARFDVV